ncbi:MAG: helix-turn-helix domain-containing protein [Christensenellales bacterium]|jgi:transcriptional regulator with XRE-family HTH domain
MFDMKKIGGNISRMRKAANLTQMELADRMGVSFQAVSNWERGQTMPDISRLSELAHALGTTVDAILGDSQAANLLEKLDHQGEPPELTGEEIQEVAPLLRPDQADAVAKNARLSLGELAALAPFVSQEVLEEIALNLADSGGSLHELAALAPFLGEKVLGKLTKHVVDEGGSAADLVAIAPFLDQADLGRIAQRLMDHGEKASELAAIAPFLSVDVVSRIALTVIREEGIAAAMPLLPFVDSDRLDNHIKAAFGKRKRW